MRERIASWLWRWVYLTLYFLGSAIVYAVMVDTGTETDPSTLAEVGAPLLALCAALTVLSNTATANKEAKMPLQDFAPGVFAVISAYFWVASSDYINRHPSDWELMRDFVILFALFALVALVAIAGYFLIARVMRLISS